MGGFDDHWMATVSPSPTAFFSSLLSDDIGSRSSENKTESSSLERDVVGPPIEQRGLMERIAARAGFNAPRLNTELTHHQEIHNHSSPYLPFSPGFSPSTLLESPVFLSNSLAQPSPTTGKFQFAPNSYGSENPTLNLDYSEKSKDDCFENMNASSFTFKPVKESSPSLFMGEASRSTLSIQDMEVSVHSETVKPSEFPSQNELIIHQKTEQDYKTEMIEYPSLDEQQDNETDQKAQSGEDGYNWRKYGQKQVKGSEYPRSYYKCTHLNCPVKKKVERSHEGHITEIIYKGAHDHPKPNRRLTGTSDYEMTSSTQSGSSTFSNDESASLNCDTEEDESESKRRRLEAYATEMTGATRASREPRVVVQTTSEVDILDDGYRWRKYGQKVVKGNPNPRSYYKCTSTGCNVRKHVERASHDLKSVITTYEGKHNHDVPAARNTNSQHIHRPEPSVMNNNMGYGSLGRLQVGPSSHGFGFGLNQQGLGGYAMGGTGSSEGHVYPYISQPCSGNDGSFVLPKGEPEVNVYNGSSGYYQIMSTLPLGPQM